MNLIEYQKKYKSEECYIKEFELKKAKYDELRERYEELRAANYKMKHKDYLLMKRLERELRYLSQKITVIRVEI